MPVARLPEDEEGEDRHPRDQRHEHRRVAPALGGLLDQRVNGTGEAARREKDSEIVDVLVGVGIDRLTDPATRHPHRQHDERHVDEEDGPPGERLDQRSAPGGADHRGDAGPRRPGSDRLPALGSLEGRGKNREGPGHEERAGQPLERPSGDQDLTVGRKTAEDRGHPEEAQADDEDAAAPELVAQGTADQEQGHQRQQVGLDYPLLIGQSRVQVVADGRQRHVDHGGVEKDDD